MASPSGKVAVLNPHLDADPEERYDLVEMLREAGYEVSHHEKESPFSIGKEYWVIRAAEEGDD